MQDFIVTLLEGLPLWLVDKVLLILAWFVVGNVKRYGLKRPSMGPLELKNTKGKTPVLDIGALDKIRHGEVKVIPWIRRFFRGGAELVNGEKVEVGFRDPGDWVLQQRHLLAKGERFLLGGRVPEIAIPEWVEREERVYMVRFTRRGLSGASQDAVQVAVDIGKAWKE